MKNFGKWYDSNYKKLLIAPAVILSIALLFLLVTYIQTGDVIGKDVSLTGGTAFTLFTDRDSGELEDFLDNDFSDFAVKTISDNSGTQAELIITVNEANSAAMEIALETFLGEALTSENSSREQTSSGLSQDFYKQLIIAVLLAFFWMSAVVFVIFSKGKKIKMKVIVINILLGYFMGNFFLSINPLLSGIIFIAFCFFLMRIYIKHSIPAFAVILAAFANIMMTLAFVSAMGINLSTAGITAFLMLIGYSVDTDILLTTRILNKKKGSINEALHGAFKTGTTMTITSIIAVTVAFIVVLPFASVLNQIFSILLVGLGFDLFNTWITNASIMKWYVEEKL